MLRIAADLAIPSGGDHFGRARHFKGFNLSSQMRMSSDMRPLGGGLTDRVPKVVFWILLYLPGLRAWEFQTSVSKTTMNVESESVKLAFVCTVVLDP